jgi:bisphosphoglycerate-dependent phosphoglycerate mutase
MKKQLLTAMVLVGIFSFGVVFAISEETKATESVQVETINPAEKAGTTEAQKRLAERQAEALKKAQEKAVEQQKKLGEQLKKSIERCAEVEKKMAEKSGESNRLKVKHAVSLNASKVKLDKLIVRLEAKGYDVTKLKADAVAYDLMIKQYISDYTNFLSSMRDTKAFACGKSEGEYKAILETSKAQLESLKSQVKAIRGYWENTVKPDIKAIKVVMEAQKAASEVEVQPTTEGGR